MVLRYGAPEQPGVRRVDETGDRTEDLMTGRAGRGEPPDLAILLEAMAAVVGEVSKVYQAVKRAVDSGATPDYRRALAAFDGLPAWQKARILRVAVARAAEVTGPAGPPSIGNSAAVAAPQP
jgi:hypothetical protein